MSYGGDEGKFGERAAHSYTIPQGILHENQQGELTPHGS
jgi:hypothetical protein